MGESRLVEIGLLIGIHVTKGEHNWTVEESLKELAELAKTAGISKCFSMIQALPYSNPQTYVGSGKLAELVSFIQERGINVLIADDELTPLQQKNLEEAVEIKVLDRTSLILDIFSKRARSHEAKLQIELAQLEYMRPRLTRLWTHLSRLGGGGVGTRGPGEKQLEVDKRLVGTRISLLKDKLQKVRDHQHTTREKRQAVPVLRGAIMGYTNAGKSTLMNLVTQASSLAEDKLFATLDPLTRRIQLPDKTTILLTDTVGFIQKLPHTLVDAFRSTLDEVSEANFLLHVIDLSHPKFLSMIETVHSLLHDLKADGIPSIYVFNKIDQVKGLPKLRQLIKTFKPQVMISALEEKNIPGLMMEIQKLLESRRKIFKFRIPYQRMDIVSLIHDHGHILKKVYEEDIQIEAEMETIMGEKIISALY